MPAQTIALIGLRGSGKSTAGPLLAQHLGISFTDLDPLTLDNASASTTQEVVDRLGWGGFREAERNALAEVLGEAPGVVALGGGTPTHEPSYELIESAQLAGTMAVVYLRAQPDELARRMERSEDRPSLTGDDPVAEIGRVFAERDDLYRELADAVIETNGLSIERVVELVLALV